MQNFHDTSGPPASHPGYTGGIDGGGGAISYPPQRLDPQSSPRIPEEYVGLQQQHHNPQTQNQHPHLMVSLQTSQAALMQGYGSRGGVTGEAFLGDTKHGGSNNPYRKDMMDYYFSSGSKEGHRRGGQALGYGTGFSNLDGQVPHQYRPARSSGSASGMSRYQMDYNAVSGGSGNSNSSSGVGAFSPSRQYNMGQNHPIQTAKGLHINLHNQAPNYSSHQTVHQGQHQRRYALSGHRFPPPVSHYQQNASAGVYNSPPPRFHSGRNGSSFECKTNNASSAASNPSPSPNINTTGQFDNPGQSYSSSDYLYNSQLSHSQQTHLVHAQRHQPNLGPGYDPHKMHSSNVLHHPGLPYSKHHSSSKSSSSSINHSIPQFPSQDISKSPMHSQTQQSQIHQNFSPISNPSPAASVVQSPSCSSSPSPLMSVLEGPGSSAGNPQSYSTVPKVRSGQNHNRLLQMMPQLSPTPSSNSSSSSCGSISGNVNATSLSANQGNSLRQTQVGVGTKGGLNDDHDHPSSPHDKLIFDAGTNSLNALTSQVANLPNTVQHMLLSDSVLSDKRSKDSGHQQQINTISTSQQKKRDPSCGATMRDLGKKTSSEEINSEGTTDEESSQILQSPSGDGGENKELVVERQTETVRSSSGTDSMSESTSGTPSQNQISQAQAKSQAEGNCQESRVHPDMGSFKTQNSSATEICLSKTVDDTDDLVHASSSLASHNSPAVLPSKILSPAHCSPASFSVTPSPTSSPSLISSTKPNQKSGLSCIHPNNVTGERGHEHLSNIKQHEAEEDDKAAVKKEKCDSFEGVEMKQDKEGGQIKQTMKEGENQIESSVKEIMVEHAKEEHSDQLNRKFNLEKSHSAGNVGVIVSTRSETTQFEEQLIENIPDHSKNSESCSSYLREDTHSHLSVIDLINHNGDGRGNTAADSSRHGVKGLSKPPSECWVASHHPNSEYQKSSLRYSELPHDSGTNNTGRPVSSEGAIETSLRYQDYHQPQHYSHEVRKRTDIEGHSRRSLMPDTGGGQEPNAQLQQPFPSLLQEVLQGYHSEKRYGHNERSSQQFPAPNVNFYSHFKQHQSMMEHSRSHVMSTHTRLSADNNIQTQVSSERLYSHKNKQDGEVCMGQVPSRHSWGTVGVVTKGAQWSTSDKNKMPTSPCHTVSNIQQTSELQPHSKHIGSSDYSLPSKRPSRNHPTSSSAMQRLLLQETDQTGHGAVGVAKHQNASLAERCSVIHDISPSFSTPEREQNGDQDKEKKNCEAQAGCPGASVIQQFSVMIEKGNINKQGVKREMKEESTHQEIKKDVSLESHCPANENASENSLHINHSKEEKDNSAKVTPYLLPQHSQHPTSKSNPLSSPSSSVFHSYFESSDESNHSTRTGGFAFEEDKKGTNKTQHQLSQHQNVSSISQTQNQQSSNKLQMYPHSHSVLYSHDLDRWTSSNNNQPSSKDVIYPGSGQQSNPSEIKLQTAMLANQQQIPLMSRCGRYYDKMWSISSEKDKEKIMEENGQKSHQSSTVIFSEVSATPAPSSDPKQFESNSAKALENTGKPYHPVCSNGSNTGNTNNVGNHGKMRTGTTGDTNPLMMRRRVRSFISPIPPKRQHQDVFQQHQQHGTPIQHSSVVSNTESRQDGDDSSGPNAAYPNLSNSKIHCTTSSEIDSSVSPSSLAKTKILPPRKSRGLKLEAIVQKITPSFKKTGNNNSGSNGDSNHLSGLSHTTMDPYSPDTQDRDCKVKGNLRGAEADTSNCLPYLGEGLSLDDIMSYKGVEDTGPPPPTAYPCDPHEDLHILKHEIMGSTDFGLGISGALKSERDSTGETVKDAFRIPPDFALLGPLPPPPPLPCPVQASPPPSSSSLSDIQNFTTYQQLETRRSEHTAAILLRQKLQESGIGLNMDNYAGRDFLGTKSPHHNPNLSHCLLSNSPHSQFAHHHPQSSAGTIMTSSHLLEPKLENAVPKGYFPSGKKKGRPVGSVNKQKRVQTQPQNLLLSICSDSQKSISAPPTTVSVEIQTTNAASPPVLEDSPESKKLPATSVSPTAISQTGNDVEVEETKPETDAKPSRQRRRKKEDSSGENVGLRQRRRGVVGVPSKDEIKSEIGTGQMISRGIFSSYRKTVFVPYIHVERKQEMGNVCTIVNGEDEKKKVESSVEDRVGKLAGKEVGSSSSTPLNSTLISSLLKKDGEKVREVNVLENVEAVLIQSSPTGKALPSSGYVLSGPVINESNTSGRLLCCLCKKWANYKDLGDLYGPYYPPDYSTRLSKNAPVTKPSQGTVRQSNTGVNVGSVGNESTEQKNPVTEIQTYTSCIYNNSVGDTDTNLPFDGAVTDRTFQVDGLNIQPDIHNTEKTCWELTPMEELNKLKQQPQQLQTGDTQKRLQHRKLTSHPRFKRRHKSNEDLPKTVPVNSKALLPFQPPPPLQLLKESTCDPSAVLALLPQVPLDPEELWVHEGCIVWASGVFLVNGRLYGLQEALDGARDTCCSYCQVVGSTLGCYSKGCTLRYHYLCAMEADCSLNEENFSLRCPKHKFSHNNKPAKVVYSDQSGRG